MPFKISAQRKIKAIQCPSDSDDNDKIENTEAGMLSISTLSITDGRIVQQKSPVCPHVKQLPSGYGLHKKTVLHFI